MKNNLAPLIRSLGMRLGGRKFATYLEHSELNLFTDDQVFTWLYSHPNHIGKIGRWIMRLNHFRFNIIHIKGKENVIAECLSIISSDSMPVNNFEEEGSSDKEYVMIRTMPEAFTNFPDWQKEDVECQEITKLLDLGNSPNYCLDKGIIYFVDRSKRKTTYYLNISIIQLADIWGRKNCILIFVYGFRKFNILLPLRDMKVGNISKVLIDRVWKIFGGSELLISDNASYFNSRIIKDMCFELGVKHVNMSPYYPCPNLVEWVNKNIKVALRIFHNSEQHGWNLNISELSLAFNSVPQSKVFLGRELPSPLLNIWGIPSECLDVSNKKELENPWQQAYANLEKAMRSIAKKYNQVTLDNPYDVGELVLCRKIY
ncbi:hypothetical protein PR048_006852 [Dryococelus australis]|uniref:Integrase catalytic domain-containing protein n=1 Tax=Dryococelus australis TaxID=614101 RepID=A0ABQ9IC28_9NEOP|nr:hypothetical protein PR048_006852 [Dryococelus australis]